MNGVDEMAKSRNEMKPLFVMGIAGPSACGKSVLAESMQSCFATKTVSYLDLDGYHLHTREERKRFSEFPDQPEANNLTQVIRDLSTLRKGRSIQMPVYDHRKGRFSTPFEVRPRPLLIVEGLHSLLLNELADERLIDLGVFIGPIDELREEWKVKRDVAFRNYSEAQVRAEIVARQPHRAAYVDSQSALAEVIVQMERGQSKAIEIRTLIREKFLLDAFRSETQRRVFDLVFSRTLTMFDKRSYYLLTLAVDELPESLRKNQLSLVVDRISVRGHDPTPPPVLYNTAADVLFRIILMLLLGEVE